MREDEGFREVVLVRRKRKGWGRKEWRRNRVREEELFLVVFLFRGEVSEWW